MQQYKHHVLILSLLIVGAIPACRSNGEGEPGQGGSVGNQGGATEGGAAGAFNLGGRTTTDGGSGGGTNTSTGGTARTGGKGAGGTLGTGGTGTGGTAGTGGTTGTGGTPGTGGTVVVIDAAKHGATANDETDDTVALQAAVTAAAGPMGTVVLPDGVFLINTHNGGLKLATGVTLKLNSKTILRAIATDAARYQVVSVRNVNHVRIEGGVVEGERDVHLGSGGEHGHCIEILSSQDVVIENVVARKCWGDGFYVGRDGNQPRSARVRLEKVTGDQNRRQGLSVTDVTGMSVNGGTFTRTSGTLPQAGIDLEPNNNGHVENVTISNTLLSGNAGNGLLVYVAPGFTASVVNTKVTMMRIVDNGRSGVNLTGAKSGEVSDNEVSNNGGVGIALNGSSDFTVTRNQVRTNVEGSIIQFGGASGNTVTANSVP